MIRTALIHHLLDYSLTKMLDNSIINLTMASSPKFNIGDEFEFITIKYNHVPYEGVVVVLHHSCITNITLAFPKKLYIEFAVTSASCKFSSSGQFDMIASCWTNNYIKGTKCSVYKPPLSNEVHLIGDVPFTITYKIFDTSIVSFKKYD